MENFVIEFTSFLNGAKHQSRLIRFWENNFGLMFNPGYSEKKTVFPDRKQAERAVKLLAEKYNANPAKGFFFRFRVRNIETLGAALKRQLIFTTQKNN